MSLKKFYDAAAKAEKRERELANRINDLFEKDQTEEALALRPELDKATAEKKEAQQLYISMQAASLPDGDPGRNFVPTGGDKEPKSVVDMRSQPEYTNQFIAALRNGVTPKSIEDGRHNSERYGMLMNALSETGGSPAGSEGGFLNPIEFDNMIHERMRQFKDLATDDYVNVEEVTAYSGWRDIETNTAEEPFSQLTELETLGDDDETESPQFSKVEYTVKDYGGFLRISNSLLADTPTNLMRYLARWFGKKVVLTNNSLILALINALTPTAITDTAKLYGAIKTVLNKSLDPAISVRSKVYTNQSGMNILDQLVDGTGRDLLQPNPTKATEFIIKGRELVMLSDKHWVNLSGPAKSRISIGDGTEFMTFFKRAAFEFATTNVGGSAWRSNSSEARGIMRADAKVMDDEAMKLLTIVIPE